MHRNPTRSLTLIAALACFVPSMASASGDWWTDPGAYLSIGGANIFEHFDGTGQDFDNSWGFSIRGGYRINKWVAVEGQLEFQNGHEVAIPLTTPVPATAFLTVDGGSGGVNGKFYAHWFGRLQPYALLGIGGQWAQLRTTYPTGFVCSPGLWWCTGTYTRLGNNGAFLAKFGGGTEFWLSEDMAAFVDATYNLPTGDLKDLRSTSLSWGFVFRF